MIMPIAMYRALTCAAMLLMTSASNAQTAFQDNFTGGYDPNIWNVRSGSNGTPFGCTFSSAMISPNPQGITLDVVPGQCAELQSKAFYQYGSVQGSLKTGYTPGTVSSIFTYTSWWDVPGRAWQEIDIEFLPSLGNLVHTNVIYQPFGGQYESWELDIGLDQYGVNIQQDLVTIGFEWGANRIQWYLDTPSGRQVIRTVTRNTAGISSLNEIPAYAWPSDPTRIMINHWHGDNTANGLNFPGQYHQQSAWAYYDYLAYWP